MGLFLPLLFPVALLLVGGVIGTVREQQHLRDLTAREAALAHVVVTDLKSLPPGMAGTAGAMVTGNVVIASDYLKQFLASMRTIVGGEVVSYRNVMDRARREARLRMLADAAAMGATLIINVRFATTDVGTAGTEVICYGTAIRP